MQPPAPVSGRPWGSAHAVYIRKDLFSADFLGESFKSRPCSSLHPGQVLRWKFQAAAGSTDVKLLLGYSVVAAGTSGATPSPAHRP